MKETDDGHGGLVISKLFGARRNKIQGVKMNPYILLAGAVISFLLSIHSSDDSEMQANLGTNVLLLVVLAVAAWVG